MFKTEILDRIFDPASTELRLSGCSEGALCYLLSRQIEQLKKSALIIASSHGDIYKYAKILDFFAPQKPYVIFPPWDCLPYDRSGPAPEIIAKRIYALKMVAHYQDNNIPFILITSVHAAFQKIRKPDIIRKNSIIAKPNKRVQIERLSKFLSLNGYLRTPTVREAGEYAVRGGIVDIFPSGFEKPVRLDFFGDVIEKIKSFDPATQISEKTLDELHLSPASEILLNEKTINFFRQNYRALCGGYVPSDDIFYTKISEGQYVQGMEAFLPLFDGDLIDIFHLMPEAYLYCDPYFTPALDEFWGDIEEYYQNRMGHAPAVLPADMYLLQDKYEEIFAQRVVRHSTQHVLPESDKVLDSQVRMPPNFAVVRKAAGKNLFDETVKIISDAQKLSKIVMILCRSEGSRERMILALKDHGLKSYKLIEYFTPEQLDCQTVYFGLCELSYGFETEHMICLTEDDIFGAKVGARKRKTKKADQFILEAQGLNIGDFVVHVENGIGKYIGLKAVEVSGALHDCVMLEYHGGDKLYIPVENIDLITRYASEGSVAVVDKLGSAAWQNRKARLKERIKDIANKLIRVAAERNLRSGEVIHPIEDLYNDFRARFPFEETEDQMAAIEAVIADMGSGRPMDRLVCGDVGFGKTEVAMRAAFLAASAGLQTAIIVPTTLLARQHYRNFLQRFEGQPFKIGRLSRMVSTKEAAATREGLAKGTVDIVIGTHALLSKKVEFQNLGLVVIDEEQHFGVNHKEKMKELKSNLHVLTLTATPIPRTLQLSMTGVRDLSLIATPPVDRLAIKTYVAPFDKDMVREALLREKYRGGQAFFVVPRLSDLHQVSEFLKNEVPEISFTIGHGQMPPTELDGVMNDFYDQKYDVLVATTIIESGIDIPTANTMIVWRSDMFGLAQLYQIRGRIGRSKLRAYAYLTVPPKKILSDAAEKRLRVLASLDSLGGGFTLASHDMDIRGAGNLLGSEQSGHIKEVGFELYQQMLEEALANLKSSDEAVDLGQGNKSPQINIGVSAIIPENYVTDLSVRMGLYRRLADIENSADIENFAAEL
ncbi:MAG: transcription-repair coupling factor, partial [Pseudomonadota bacterium]